MFIRFCISFLIVLIACAVIQSLKADEPSSAIWRKHTINDRSPFEAVGVADFNQDGKLDVFSGDSWYSAPDWKRHRIRVVKPGTNPHYYEDFSDAPLDVNGDGRVDIVTCAYFSRRIGWVEQPKDPTTPWTEHLIDLPGSMETSYLLDLYGDGTPVYLPNVGGQVLWYELLSAAPAVKWKKRQLSPDGAGHGVGHGDVNFDGRIDIITPKGWYEQPTDRESKWHFHNEFELGHASIKIIGHDFNGDGDTDIMWGMGHDYGLHWMSQSKDEKGKRIWTKEDIDTTFSQVHMLDMADFDGDGEMEVVTGKRIYAHAAEDGATAHPGLYVYGFDRNTKKWKRTTVYRGSPALNAPAITQQRDALEDFPRGSAGTGLQITVKDMDNDGDLDIVTPGKSGLYWFENLRVTK